MMEIVRPALARCLMGTGGGGGGGGGGLFSSTRHTRLHQGHYEVTS